MKRADTLLSARGALESSHSMRVDRRRLARRTARVRYARDGTTEGRSASGVGAEGRAAGERADVRLGARSGGSLGYSRSDDGGPSRLRLTCTW